MRLRHMIAGPRPLRILMTADAVGGVWQYALALARALGPERATMMLAINGPAPNAAQQRHAASLTHVTLRHHPFRLEWMADAQRDLAPAAAWLRALAADFRPDIVHLNGYALAALPWPVPVVVVGHSCVLSWWQAVHGEAAPAEWDGYAERVARGIAAADGVIAPSAAMLSSLAAHYGLPRPGQIIANGCALEGFVDGPKEDFILAAGRLWDEGKNLAALDAAARHLPWPVFLAGDRRHPNGGETKLRAARALGPLDGPELSRWMARAAVYAFPALYEPFGLSVLEAAASGCALVLGDIPSLRENWDGAALFVPPRDAVAIAGAIADLMCDRARRAALADAARRRSRRFSAAAMAQGYAAAYGAFVASEACAASSP